MRHVLFLLLMCALSPAGYGWNWQGTVRAKAQVDNRYTIDPLAFGEFWGQSVVDAAEYELKGALDFVGRTTEQGGGGYGKLYQGFIDKGFSAIDSRLKLGRFQRTDNMGLYLLDGGAFSYAPSTAGWAVDVYAGRPSRIDHVLSVDGLFLGGLGGRTQFLPHWGGEGDFLTLDTVDLRGGYQYFINNGSNVPALPIPVPGQYGTAYNPYFLEDAGIPGALSRYTTANGKRDFGTDRLNFATTAAGKLRVTEYGKYELGLLGTYRADDNSIQDAMINGQLDFTQNVRFRSSYEYFRPRQPYLTFREKFYSAYALGEQTMFRARVHHTPVDGFTYYLGGMRATREGYDGYGGDIGNTYALTPNLSLFSEIDYLALGPDNAKTAYVSLLHTVNSRLQIRINTALLFEDKQLYGDNRAIGAEGEIRYMISNALILNVAGSNIWNTRLKQEYLGAVQLIYYFDNFKPKDM